jgi:hypothetical protein
MSDRVVALEAPTTTRIMLMQQKRSTGDRNIKIGLICFRKSHARQFELSSNNLKGFVVQAYEERSFFDHFDDGFLVHPVASAVAIL